MSKVIMDNIGILFSGDVDKPILNANSILIDKGNILEVGTDLAADSDTLVINAQGMAVSPGLIDSHCHPVIGDWTPRQSALGWIDSYVKAGVTGLVSAGETHIPGKPSDAEGCKALAILAYKTYKNYRPAGMKVYGGALIMQSDATEEDFAECARIGMGHTGEIGLGTANTPETAGPMTGWGRKHGIKTLCHRGAIYLEGSSVMDTETILGINPDIVCHITYGNISVKDIKRYLDETAAQVELCRTQLSNVKNTLDLLGVLKERNEFKRLMLGNDAPSGFGIYPHGIWEMICLLTSVGNIPPEIAIACATGNTARFHGFPAGIIKPGYNADLIAFDAPIGSSVDDAYKSMQQGTIPAVSMVMIDGVIMAEGDKVNTAPAKRRIIM